MPRILWTHLPEFNEKDKSPLSASEKRLPFRFQIFFSVFLLFLCFSSFVDFFAFVIRRRDLTNVLLSFKIGKQYLLSKTTVLFCTHLIWRISVSKSFSSSRYVLKRVLSKTKSLTQPLWDYHTLC